MEEEKYKLAFFGMIRNNIMASPCPEEPNKRMLEKYDKEHINRVAKLTMEKMTQMCNFDVLKKDYDSK